MKGQNRSFFLDSHLSYNYSTFIFMYHEMAEILPLGHKTFVQPINQWDIPRGRDEFCARVKHTEILSKWHEKQHRITQGIGLHRFRIRQVILYYWPPRGQPLCRYGWLWPIKYVLDQWEWLTDKNKISLYRFSQITIVCRLFKKWLRKDSFISFHKMTNQWMNNI